MKVALYARCSSDNQRDASIEDQLRLCRTYAEKQGWTISDSYNDRALSGASLLRPGLQALIADASHGCFQRFIKDPDTGKRVSRLNPENEWVTQAAAEFRIVDDELWLRVKERQQSFTISKPDNNNNLCLPASGRGICSRA